MNYLNTLTPAEIKLLLDFSKNPFKELLKLTFMDLVLKNVLQVMEMERQASSHDPIQIHKYVVAGPNIHSYFPLLHEQVFLSPFRSDKTAEILFKNFVKTVYQNAISGRHYRSVVISNLLFKKHYRQNWLQHLYGGYTITDTGHVLKKEIEQELIALETQLRDIVDKEPEKARQVLATVFGNVYLLESMNHELMKEMDTTLAAEWKRNDAGCATVTGCGFTSTHSHGKDFDSSCSGHDGGSGGGDSGCSGCGGCSGGD